MLSPQQDKPSLPKKAPMTQWDQHRGHPAAAPVDYWRAQASYTRCAGYFVAHHCLITDCGHKRGTPHGEDRFGGNATHTVRHGVAFTARSSLQSFIARLLSYFKYLPTSETCPVTTASATQANRRRDDDREIATKRAHARSKACECHRCRVPEADRGVLASLRGL